MSADHPANPGGWRERKRRRGRRRKRLSCTSGGGGIRTPKGLRPPHFECGALPVRTTPPECETARARARVCRASRPQLPVGETGFEPATPASRTQCSTRLSYSPNESFQRTGWDSNPRGLFTPHDFQSCAFSHSATRPNLRRAVPRGRRPRQHDGAEREGFEPSRAIHPNALAGRRLKPLGHLSQTAEGSVRPPTPRSCPSWVRTRTLLIQSQACCQLHQGAIDPSARLAAAGHR